MVRRKENNVRNRSQIITGLMLKRLMQEKILLAFLVGSILYGFISNLLIGYNITVCPSWFSVIGKSIDDVIRNTCYGVIAGISFYLVNDLYKNVYTKVDVFNAMFNKLYMILFNATSLVQAVSGENYKKYMSREQTFRCIMNNLCNEEDDFRQIGSLVKKRQISVERFTLLANKWEETNGMRKGFLEIYGNMLTTDEQYSLSRYEYDSKTELLRTIYQTISDTDQQHAEVVDRDIAAIVNMIVGYKICLTDLSRKYISYAYSMGNQKRASI